VPKSPRNGGLKNKSQFTFRTLFGAPKVNRDEEKN
jgi:hypothetical protein